MGTLRTAALMLVLGLALAAVPAHAQSAPAEHGQPAQPGAHETAAAGASHGQSTGEAGGDAHEGSSVVGTVAKLLNFSILAGTLVYFLRSPLRDYLSNRGVQIRADLTKAGEMRTAAAAQLAAVEQKMAALPAELDALRTTGAAEVAAEEARIRDAAARERDRLLTQMQREIALRGRVAERDLLHTAAGKAVAVATAEVKRIMTPADHARLEERYVERVGG
jgi:F0F1-type ATP synthase membrane subunit b/b'